MVGPLHMGRRVIVGGIDVMPGCIEFADWVVASDEPEIIICPDIMDDWARLIGVPIENSGRFDMPDGT